MLCPLPVSPPTADRVIEFSRGYDGPGGHLNDFWCRWCIPGCLSLILFQTVCRSPFESGSSVTAYTHTQRRRNTHTYTYTQRRTQRLHLNLKHCKSVHFYYCNSSNSISSVFLHTGAVMENSFPLTYTSASARCSAVVSKLEIRV